MEMKKADFMFKKWSMVFTFCAVILIKILFSHAISAYQPIVTIGKPALSDIQYAPNGLYLATLTHSFIELLDTETFNPISRIYTPARDSRIVISSDSSLITVYGYKGIYIYDVLSRELIMNTQNYVGAAEFSPDGKYLAYSEGYSIVFWDIAQKKIVKKISGDPELLSCNELNSINSIAFHPTGRLLAVSSCHRTIALWNIETGKIESYLDKENSQLISMMQFSNDGTLLAVLCDNLVKLFNISDGSWYYTPGTEVNSIAFTNDDKYLLIGESRGELIIYSINTQKYETRPVVKRTVPASWGFCLINKITTSPDGRKFASLLNDTRIAIWDIKSFSRIKTLHGWGWYFDAVYLPKANRIITGTYSMDLCFWDATTGELDKTVEFYYDVECMTVSPDGKNVAVCAE